MIDLLNHLDFWLMLFTLGAMAYFLLWKDYLQPLLRGLFPPRTTIVHPRPRLRSHPIRGALGRFDGSRPAANAVPAVTDPVPQPERGSSSRSASESDVPGGNEVPSVPVSVPEVVQITAQLMRGAAPSDVAKTLPGYSARNYQAYMAKVRQVKAELDLVAQEEAHHA